MTNRASSKQHGLSSANIQRPKSKLRSRRNKAKARIHREARQAELAQLLAKPKKSATQKPQVSTAKKPTITKTPAQKKEE